MFNFRNNNEVWTGLTKMGNTWGDLEGKVSNYSLWADGHPTADFDFSIWKKNETLVDDPAKKYGQICETNAISKCPRKQTFISVPA